MKIINNSLLDELSEKAVDSPRKRAHFNLHPNLDDKIHRLCIAIEPGSYIRPHRHYNPAKWELMTLLRGSITVLTFDDNGIVTNSQILCSGQSLSIEIESDVWHTFIANDSKSALLEVKRGPYSRPIDSDFAAWAPEEGDAKVTEFLEWFNVANVGDKIH